MAGSKGKDSNPKKAGEKKKRAKIDTSIIILLTAILVMSIFSYNLMSEKIRYDSLMEECKEIEQHKGLSVPCTCFPYTKPENLSDMVDRNTDEFCRCICQISDNQTKVFDVLRAK